MTMLGMYVTIQFVSKIFKVFHLRVPLIIVNKESKKFSYLYGFQLYLLNVAQKLFTLKVMKHIILD